MLLKTFIPSPATREFVEFFRIVHFQLSGLEQPEKFYPPRPEHCLSFYPYDREKIYFDAGSKNLDVPPAMLNGQQLYITRRLPMGSNFLILHIILRPTALYRLTNIAAYEFNNDFLDAELVFGEATRHVNDELREAGTYDRMIGVAERFIMALVRKRCLDTIPLDKVCASLGQWPSFTIEQAARSAYISTRQLQRKFRERTGLTPKLFDRATRFHQTIDLRLKNPALSWIDIAYKSGYSNYQHLVRDYNDFTGMTPTAYAILDGRSPERKLGLADMSYKLNTGGYLV